MQFAPGPHDKVRFCPQCGAALMAGARFCVECGAELSSLTPGAANEPVQASRPAVVSEPAATPAAPRAAAVEQSRSLGPFIAIFGAILAVGIAVALIILRQLPQREKLLASAPPPPAAAQANGLPPGHPKIELPEKAKVFIAQIEQKAKANPKDIKAWDQLGDVSARAGTFDPSYYVKADDAYAHVLKLNPNDPDALRGVGNIDFDQRKYDEAIAAYEHYLSEKPNDPDVRTDLGTMFLSNGNVNQAVAEYKKVLAANPQFFEATFNLGIAYGQMNKIALAQSTFEHALSLAPDSEDRNRVNEMLAQLQSMGSGSPTSTGGGASTVENTSVAAPADTFQGAMDQMLRGLPVAGPKVASVQWPSATHARVMMNDFPMNEMPPFAATKFISDLKSGIETVKTAHKVTGTVRVDICDAGTGTVMKTVTVAGTSGGAATVEDTAVAAPADTFQGAMDQMLRGLPVAGPKVASVQWPSATHARVMMDDFPMNEMPPFAAAKFISDLKSGIAAVKTAHKVTGTVEVDICDGATGSVMKTVSE